MNGPDCVVALDDFQFSELEIPDEIPFGGDQMLGVQKLVGGARVVDAMGRDDADLAWSGEFLGPLALARARFLDSLRAAGDQHILTWNQFRYLVVVKSFSCRFQRYYKLPYSITLLVIQDLAAPTVTFPVVSTDAAINSDNNMAQGLGGLIGDGTLSTLLGGLNNAISAVTTFANAAQATINSVLLPLQAVQQQVNTLLAAASNTLINVGDFGGLLNLNPVQRIVAKVNAEVANATQSDLLVQLQSVTGRMSTNLNLVAGPLNSHTRAVAGTTLYHIAEQEYGDSTQWPVIAKANGLSDPKIGSTVKTLTIPNQPGPATGGILTA